MLTVEEIKQYIDTDKSSRIKRFAATGQRYYEGNHDIRRYKLYYYNADGNLVEDKNRANIKIPHTFFTELVDQEVQYMLSGKGGFVKSDTPELQTKLDEYFNENEDFCAELYDLLTGTISSGFGYMYAYRNSEDKTAFQYAEAAGIVEVRSKDTGDGCEYIIYWYIDHIDKENKVIKKIQVWDRKQTYFYVQEWDNEILLDKSEPYNPRPHIVYRRDNDESAYYEEYGFIPFFRLDNNRKQFSGLKPIKELIDDYDLMACGLSNNLQDASEYLVVVRGFSGDKLDELMTNVRTKKHIGVDEDGGVEYKTVDIPYEARKTKMDLDEKNIYRFGMGFNSAAMGDGNITNIVIKSRYALLDLKCNKLEIRLRQLMRRLLDVVLAEINRCEGTDYRQRDVYFDFRREVMTNAQDNAQIALTEAQTQQTVINTLLAVSAQLGDEILMENICDALDLDYDDIKGKLPTDEEKSLYGAQDALSGVNINAVEQNAEGNITESA